MRKLVIAVVAIELLGLTACGYTLAEDTELTDALSWARSFKAEQPAVARAIAHGCKKTLSANAYFTRDGALQLFTCIRKEAEAQGYA
jgi:outer membrane lipopolysaccharide assembly protein LptE/RlpB